MLAGRSGIAPISSFDASQFRSRIAGEVKNFQAANYIDDKNAERLERFTLFSLAAAQEALAQAGIANGSVAPERAAVVVGTGIGGQREVERMQSRLVERGPRSIHPFAVLKNIGNGACGQISLLYDFQGPSFCPTSACASGAHALALALDLLRAGRADVVIAGGAEAYITPLSLASFGAMQALSMRNDDPCGASRPFDESRDGFVIAEGCGLAVLETSEHAARRGAKPLAEFRGAGMSSDAHHLANPHPEGRGYVQAMRWALEDGATAPSDIGYINAHATSTRMCDEIEAIAVHKVFGPHCARLMMSSTKSMTGHLLGGAGGLEFATIVQSLIDQVCPPTINLERPAEACAGLDLVPGRARKAELKAAMSNSFGFGGHNVSLLAAAI
jgi:3-oxoacyl-[acyl-carrier-protein] synthase II